MFRSSVAPGWKWNIPNIRDVLTLTSFSRICFKSGSLVHRRRPCTFIARKTNWGLKIEVFCLVCVWKSEETETLEGIAVYEWKLLGRPVHGLSNSHTGGPRNDHAKRRFACPHCIRLALATDFKVSECKNCMVYSARKSSSSSAVTKELSLWVILGSKSWSGQTSPFKPVFLDLLVCHGYQTEPS